eukprot:XP_017945369.1 PREDICTED: stimulated by retinoic acid gene 8 protein homolog [Xenopus tropicalis]
MGIIANSSEDWRQVLNQTKNYIKELENTLENLLRTRDDRMPCTLEQVKEEYLQLYCIDTSSPVSEINSDNDLGMWYLSQECETDIGMNEVVENSEEAYVLPATSSDVMDFERYMQFYQQTMDTLVENTVISQEEVSNPVVSKAVADLWQDLSQEGTVELYLEGCQQARIAAHALACSENVGCSGTTVRDSGAESQEASCSYVSSTPEEMLFEDALEHVAAGFLDQSKAQDVATSPSSESSSWECLDTDCFFYSRVTDFLKACLCSYTQEAMLQCPNLPIIIFSQNAEQQSDNMEFPVCPQDAVLQYDSLASPVLLYSWGAPGPCDSTGSPELFCSQDGALLGDDEAVLLTCMETLDDDM